MKLLQLAVFMLATSMASMSQVVVFTDDFESGTTKWTLTMAWGLTSSQNHSPSNSLTDSPGSNYTDQSTSYATMKKGVNFSNALDADLSFWASYQIEQGFDYCYVDVSGDGGTSWINIASFDSDTVTPWKQYNYSLSGFVGKSNVVVRFRLVSDNFLNFDGIYIDDFEITTDTIDNGPPLILNFPIGLYEGSLKDHHVVAEVIDISGIANTTLNYTVDGGGVQTVAGINTTGDNFLFTVPQQSAGSNVNYWIDATDASSNSNSSVSDTFKYVAGNYIKYGKDSVDFVASFGPASMSNNMGAAVRFTLPGATNIVSGLIRNYTDMTNPNDSIEIHVWDDSLGAPNNDLITPFKVFPAANLIDPYETTNIDLRSFTAQLSGLSGDVWLGFLVPVGEAWVGQSTPGTGNRTSVFDGTMWGTITDDYHFRIVTDSIIGAPVADFTFANDPNVLFTDASTGTPVSWSWDFDDGGAMSTAQNPSHIYSLNGTKNVCLTATNAVTSDIKCLLVPVAANAPIADFNYIFLNDTMVKFNDLSANDPTSWNWDFADGGATSTMQSPTYKFSGVGTYNVCLEAINANGNSPIVCQNVTVSIQPPGIDEGEPYKVLQVYPHPLNQVSYVNVAIGSDIYDVALIGFDVLGRVIEIDYRVDHNRIAIKKGNLKEGLYFFSIRYRNEVIGIGKLMVD